MDMIFAQFIIVLFNVLCCIILRKTGLRNFMHRGFSVNSSQTGSQRSNWVDKYSLTLYINPSNF